MTSQKNRHSFWFKTIRIAVVCLFLFNNFAFTLNSKSHSINNACLATTSRFNPIAVVKKRGEGFLVLADLEETKRAIADFKRNVGLSFLNPLIELGLPLGLSEKGLKRLIEERLSKTNIDTTNVKWRELIKDGDTVYLPYIDENGNERRVQYYVPLGEENVRIILEDFLPLVGKEQTVEDIAERIATKTLHLVQREQITAKDISDMIWTFSESEFLRDANGKFRPFSDEEIFFVLERVNTRLIEADFAVSESFSHMRVAEPLEQLRGELIEGRQSMSLDLYHLKRLINNLGAFFNTANIKDTEYPVFLARDAVTAGEFLRYFGLVRGHAIESASVYQPGMSKHAIVSDFVEDEDIERVQHATELAKARSIEKLQEERKIPGRKSNKFYDVFHPSVHRELAEYFKRDMIRQWEKDPALKRMAEVLFQQMKRNGITNHRNLVLMDLAATGKTILYVKSVLEYFSEREGINIGKVRVFIGYSHDKKMCLPEVKLFDPSFNAKGRPFKDQDWPFYRASYSEDSGDVIFKPHIKRSSALVHVYRSLKLYNAALKSSNTIYPLPDTRRDWIGEKAIYQVMVKDYAPPDYGKSTFAYIEDDIDRLKEKGIGTIWLCGIASNLDGTTPFSVLDPRKIEERYGTVEELKSLITKAHNRGMRVITDYIPNYVSIHSELCKIHPDWFIKDEQGNFVHATDNRALHGWSELAQFDFLNPEVRKYLMDVAHFWLELGFDGLRLDAPLGLLKTRMKKNWYEGREAEVEKAFPQEFWEMFTKDIRKSYPNAAFVAEYLGEEPDILNVLADCGIDLTLDIQFSCLLYDVLRGQNKKVSTDVMDYLRRNITTRSFAKKVHYKDTHDIRDMTKTDFGIGQERLRLLNTDEIRLIATLSVTLPGVPMFFNGEPEAVLGYEYHVNKGFPISWDNFDPQMRLFYENLLQLANQPIFREGTAQIVEQKRTKNPDIISFIREYKGERVIVAADIRNEEDPYTGKDWVSLDIEDFIDTNKTYDIEDVLTGRVFNQFDGASLKESGLLVGLLPREVQLLRLRPVTSDKGESDKRKTVSGDDSLEDEHRIKKWYEVNVRDGIDIDLVKENLYEIQEILDFINRELTNEDQYIKEDEFTNQLIEQYGGGVKRFNEVILNGPMTPERLEEEYKRFHAKIGKEGLIVPAGEYETIRGNDIKEVKEVFSSLFSEEYDEKIKLDPIKIAAEVFVRLVNRQPFNDGNKRAASLIMNYILMKSGYTAFILTEDNVLSYTKIVKPINDENEIDEETFTNFLYDEVKRIHKPSYFAVHKTDKGKKDTEQETEKYISEKVDMTSDFVDTIILRAIDARERGEKIIIGIDTSWIPKEQLRLLSGLNGLLNELTKRAKKMGLDNDIVILKEKGNQLANLLIEEAGETNKRYSNVIVLGNQKILKGKAFRPLRSHENPDNWAFFAGINLPNNFTEKSYIMLLEMLELTVERAFGKDVTRDDIDVSLFRPDGNKPPVPRHIILVPKAKVLEYDTLQKIYKGQKKIITAA